jgi:hypothetical protein
MLMTGACLCGAIRYECSGTPVFQFNCHCRDCQRCTGAAFAPILFFPKSAVVVHGKARYFAMTGKSGGQIRRGFCPDCGSHLFGDVDLMPDHLSIRAGTLDDPSLFQPKADIFVSHANHWDPMDPALAKFPEEAARR